MSGIATTVRQMGPISHAWIDESAHVTGPGFYVLAATISEPADAHAIREALSGLVYPRQQRIALAR